MCIDFDGHHSGGSSFVNENDFCYYRNYVCITTGTSSTLRKNRSMRVPAVQSRTGLGSDPPFGSDRECGVTFSIRVGTKEDVRNLPHTARPAH